MRNVITKSFSMPPEIGEWLDEKAILYKKEKGYGSASFVLSQILTKIMQKEQTKKPKAK